MGADLYWKETPKEQDENLTCMSLSTWQFLSDLWKLREIEDINEWELNKNHLPQLEAVYLTAKLSNNKDLTEDIKSLIDGILKYESITLTIRY